MEKADKADKDETTPKPSAGFRSFKKLQNSSRENLPSEFRFRQDQRPSLPAGGEGKMLTSVNRYKGDIGRSTVKFQKRGVKRFLRPTPHTLTNMKTLKSGLGLCAVGKRKYCEGDTVSAATRATTTISGDLNLLIHNARLHKIYSRMVIVVLTIVLVGLL